MFNLWFEAYTLRRMWPAIQAILVLGSLGVIINLDRHAPEIAPALREELLWEALPGGLIGVWWTFRACRSVWRFAVRIASRFRRA